MFNRSTEVDVSLRNAVAIVTDALAKRDKLVAALARASAAENDAEAGLQQAMVRLGDAEADIALTETAPSKPDVERRAVSTARENLEIARATVEALNGRMPAVEQNLVDAHQTYTAARLVWASVQMDAYRAEYLKAAEAFASIARKGITIGAAVGRSTVGLEALKLCDIDMPLESVSIVCDTEYIGGAWSPIPAWNGSAKLEGLHSSLMEAQGPRDQLEQVIGDIRRQRAAMSVQPAMK